MVTFNTNLILIILTTTHLLLLQLKEENRKKNADQIETIHFMMKR